MKPVYFASAICLLSAFIILFHKKNTTLTEKKNKITRLLEKNQILEIKIISLQNEITKIKIKKKELRKCICNLLYNPQEDCRRVIQKEKWPCILNAINCAYDQFTVRLRLCYPKLKEEDLLLCCLFKLGLNSSEISIRMNISNITVRVRKSRLRKVLEITDRNIDLNAFLDQF